MLKKTFACSLLLISGLSNATTNTLNTFNATQTQAIENIVRQYLVQHPQVLAEAANALAQQQQNQWQTTATKVVPELGQSLFAAPESPVVGNPAGQISVVEFFDYQCPHCKDMGPQIEKLLQKDHNLRIILKALPIFGANSEFAAKAALAAQQQGKFLAFHQALLATQDRLTRDKVLAIAKQVGLNIPRLLTNINNPAITQELKQNDALAKQLKLTGTPGFVIAKVNFTKDKVTAVLNPLFIPGAVQGSVLAEAIAEASRGQG